MGISQMIVMSSEVSRNGGIAILNETLFATPKPLDLERDQCHPPTRSRVCAAHHIHDHHTATRKQHELGDPIQRRKESANQFFAGANGLNRSHRYDPVQQSSRGLGNPERAIDPGETDKSRCRNRDSTRSRFASAKIDWTDGCVATHGNHQGRHRYKSGNKIDGERPAFAELRRGKCAVLAKRYLNRCRSRRAHCRINSLESGCQSVIKCGEHRLVRWRARYRGWRTRNRAVAISDPDNSSGRTQTGRGKICGTCSGKRNRIANAYTETHANSDIYAKADGDSKADAKNDSKEDLGGKSLTTTAAESEAQSGEIERGVREK